MKLDRFGKQRVRLNISTRKGVIRRNAEQRDTKTNQDHDRQRAHARPLSTTTTTAPAVLRFADHKPSDGASSSNDAYE